MSDDLTARITDILHGHSWRLGSGSSREDVAALIGAAADQHYRRRIAEISRLQADLQLAQVDSASGDDAAERWRRRAEKAEVEVERLRYDSDWFTKQLQDGLDLGGGDEWDADDLIELVRTAEGDAEKLRAEVERLRAEVPPCDGGCNINDGPAEDCSAHGRTPRYLWTQLDIVRGQRDEALGEVERLRGALGECVAFWRERYDEGAPHEYGDYNTALWDCISNVEAVLRGDQ